MKTLKTVGILLFDNVELLDFAGPLQVFSSFKSLYPHLIDKIETIGLTRSITVSKSQLVINCNDILTSESAYDLIIIPGGIGTRHIINDELALNRIRNLCQQSTIATSVCTGSLILAQLGLLTNLTATTHHSAFKLMEQIDSTITIDANSRYIDHEQVIIAQGVSAGIDMSLYLLEKYYSVDIKTKVEDYIEYNPELQDY